MICYCSKKYCGAGREYTPITLHLYVCIFNLDYYGIEYEIFKEEYDKYNGEYSDSEIAHYVIENFS